MSEAVVKSPSSNSVAMQFILAAQSTIQGLNLDGIVDSSIVWLKIPLERIYKREDLPVARPCIILSPEGEEMDPTQGPIGYDDVVYRILCVFCSADQEPTLQANLDSHLYWIECVAKAFRNKRVASVSTSIISSVKPAKVVMPEFWKQNTLAGALMLRFTSREPRS